MKVLCCIKRVIDPYVAARVRTDGSGVETANVKHATNPFCENALEQALRWKDAGKVDELAVLCIGPAAATDNLRAALARGADRALHLISDTAARPLEIAKAIAAVVDRDAPDVVLLGKQSIDGDNNQTGQMLAGLLDWPQALFLSKAEIFDGGIEAESEVDDGIACFKLPLPCVLTADLRLNEPRLPALPAIMKAKSKPIESLTQEGLGIDLAAGRLETVSVSPPPQRQRGAMVEDAAALASAIGSRIKDQQ